MPTQWPDLQMSMKAWGVAILVLAASLALSLIVSGRWGLGRARIEALVPGAEAEVQRGQELYRNLCQQCHGDREGMGRIPRVPPHGSQGHTWHHPDGELVDFILSEAKRQGFVPQGGPVTMQSFGSQLSRSDVLDILAYLKTWWTPEQRAFQEDLSRRHEEGTLRFR